MGTGGDAQATFDDLVDDLTDAVSGNELASALSEDLGVVLDKDAFVAPTTFIETELKISTPAPTPNRFPRPVAEEDNFTRNIIIAISVTLVAICTFSMVGYYYLKQLENA